MIFPSFAVAFTLVTSALASTSSNRVKRQNTSASAAASAALTLNSAVAYTICIISQGTFQAAAALGSKARFASCDTINPFTSTAKVATVTLSLSGCPNYVPTLGRRAAGGSVGGNTCSPLLINYAGQLSPLYNSAPIYFYTIPSSNGMCSGINQPFQLLPSNGVPQSSFTDNKFNINCSNGIITLAPVANTHFCVITDSKLVPSLVAQPSTNTCSNTYTLTLSFVTSASN